MKTTKKLACSFAALAMLMMTYSPARAQYYEDPSYFSRDYKKQFGAPPQRDLARLRQNLETTT